MEYDEGNIVLVDIWQEADREVFVGIYVLLAVYKGILGTGGAERHVFTALHIGHVDRAGPVAGGIHQAALLGILTNGTLDIQLLLAHLGLAYAIGDGTEGGQVTT